VYISHKQGMKLGVPLGFDDSVYPIQFFYLTTN